MWFSEPGGGKEEAQDDAPYFETAMQAVENSLRSATCYALMKESSKVLVFEHRVSFHLAVCALIENSIQVAPVWDGSRFVGIMSVSDYVDAARLYHAHQRPVEELAQRTIADMLESDAIYRIKFRDFSAATTLDAEDSVYEAVRLLRRLGVDYVPVMDPDEGNLLATLGHHDVLGLVLETARTHPQLFMTPVSELRIGTFGHESVVTAPAHAPLSEVLALLEQRGISAVPITDAAGRVTSIYHRADVTFLASATDPEASMSNLDVPVGEILEQQQGGTSLVTCSATDTLLQALHRTFEAHTTRLLCLDDGGRCLGIISVKDLVGYFLDA